MKPTYCACRRLWKRRMDERKGDVAIETWPGLAAVAWFSFFSRSPLLSFLPSNLIATIIVRSLFGATRCLFRIKILFRITSLTPISTPINSSIQMGKTHSSTRIPTCKVSNGLNSSLTHMAKPHCSTRTRTPTCKVSHGLNSSSTQAITCQVSNGRNSNR